MIPSPVMESPLTCKRNEASGLAIRYSSMEKMSQRASSSGEGKPAFTEPTRGTAKVLSVKAKCPFSSLRTMPAPMSFSTQKLTTLLDLTSRSPIISPKEGIRRFSLKKVAMIFRTDRRVRFSFMGLNI